MSTGPAPYVELPTELGGQASQVKGQERPREALSTPILNGSMMREPL
jgi:hypothetical protein